MCAFGDVFVVSHLNEHDSNAENVGYMFTVDWIFKNQECPVNDKNIWPKRYVPSVINVHILHKLWTSEM